MSNTQNLVMQLKQAGQDAEWYPTTEKMILQVMQWLPKDADSIMDVGAGDGRVLKRFSEKCEHATLYSIERSQILIQNQPENVVPVGTEFFEQNLSCLAVNYIFCNPPYSEYEDWACKLISEGYAKKLFLIIPRRWKDSERIKDALKLRGASAHVIASDDFLEADRKARAIVDIVDILYPTEKWGETSADPFDRWFDQNIDTFERAKDFQESESGEALARRHSTSTIPEMVEAYRDEYNRMQENYRAIFKLDYAILKELGVDKKHVRDGLKLKMAGLKNKYWKVLFNRLDAITSRLSTASKKKLLDRLTGNTAVEFTEGNACSVVLWAIKNSNKYFDEQLIQLFRDLATFEGVSNYKSNTKTWNKDEWRYSRWDFQKLATHYALDYRIVIQYGSCLDKGSYSRWEYPGGLYRDRHDNIADIIAVMSNLGFSTHSQSSLDRVWTGGKWQDWYTSEGEILFQVKAYQNGNMHMRFMPEAIKALNIEAGRLLKWVRTKDDVIKEMGYTVEDLEKYFKSNSHILTSSVKLLEAPKHS